MTIEIADLPPSKWWFSEGRSSPKAIRQARPTPKARELKTEAEVIAPRPPEAGRSPVGLDISMIFGWDFGWFSDEIFVDFWWDFWGSSTGFWMILDEIFVDFWWDFWGSSTGFWMILNEIFNFLRCFDGFSGPAPSAVRKWSRWWDSPEANWLYKRYQEMIHSCGTVPLLLWYLRCKMGTVCPELWTTPICRTGCSAIRRWLGSTRWELMSILSCC